jgi:hypothetical protein
LEHLIVLAERGQAFGEGFPELRMLGEAPADGTEKELPQERCSGRRGGLAKWRDDARSKAFDRAAGAAVSPTIICSRLVGRLGLPEGAPRLALSADAGARISRV